MKFMLYVGIFHMQLRTIPHVLPLVYQRITKSSLMVSCININHWLRTWVALHANKALRGRI